MIHSWLRVSHSTTTTTSAEGLKFSTSIFDSKMDFYPTERHEVLIQSVDNPIDITTAAVIVMGGLAFLLYILYRFIKCENGAVVWTRLGNWMLWFRQKKQQMPVPQNTYDIAPITVTEPERNAIVNLRDIESTTTSGCEHSFCCQQVLSPHSQSYTSSSPFPGTRSNATLSRFRQPSANNSLLRTRPQEQERLACAEVHAIHSSTPHSHSFASIDGKNPTPDRSVDLFDATPVPGSQSTHDIAPITVTEHESNTIVDLREIESTTTCGCENPFWRQQVLSPHTQSTASSSPFTGTRSKSALSQLASGRHSISLLRPQEQERLACDEMHAIHSSTPHSHSSASTSSIGGVRSKSSTTLDMDRLFRTNDETETSSSTHSDPDPVEENYRQCNVN